LLSVGAPTPAPNGLNRQQSPYSGTKGPYTSPCTDRGDLPRAVTEPFQEVLLTGLPRTFDQWRKTRQTPSQPVRRHRGGSHAGSLSDTARPRRSGGGVMTASQLAAPGTRPAFERGMAGSQIRRGPTACPTT
jgi:hypothetical protein